MNTLQQTLEAHFHEHAQSVPEHGDQEHFFFGKQFRMQEVTEKVVQHYRDLGCGIARVDAATPCVPIGMIKVYSPDQTKLQISTIFKDGKTRIQVF